MPMAVPKQWSFDQLRSDREMKNIAKVLLLGASGGAIWRGSRGLANLISRNVSPPKVVRPELSLTKFPFQDDEEEPKVAAERSWWYVPALAAAGTGGAAAGWKGVDWILDRQRRKIQEAELEDAENRFREAIQVRMKAASGEPDALDVLFDQVEKQGQGGMWESLKNMGRGTRDAALMWALLSPAIAGTWAYTATRDRSRRKLLDKAIKRRRYIAARRRPPSVQFALPEPSDTEEEEKANRMPMARRALPKLQAPSLG